MLLQRRNQLIQSIHSKSLSKHMWISGNIFIQHPQSKIAAKALHCVRQKKWAKAGFTVEAAFVVPFFLLAAVVILGLFPLILVQTQVSSALQYAGRMVALSYRDEEDGSDVLSLAEGEVLFLKYIGEHGLDEDSIEGGKAGISLLQSNLSGEYVTLTASYRVELPISFWKISKMAVTQSVKAKKWTGAADADGSGDGSGDAVYITPSGSAYHTRSDCPYLDLSIHSVPVVALKLARSLDGSIYYPCSCYQGGATAYITNYGNEYHSSLNCSDLKRTVYTVSADEIGTRHACPKCVAGD